MPPVSAGVLLLAVGRASVSLCLTGKQWLGDRTAICGEGQILDLLAQACGQLRAQVG